MLNYQTYFDWIDSQHAEMVTRLQGWSGINTGTFNPAGVNTLGELLAAEFGQFADVASLHESPGHETIDASGMPTFRPLGKNLHVVHRSEAPLKVLLAIHMDTVYGVESSFQQVEQLDENRLRGPGVADAKGGIVILLYALQAFERFAAATGQSRLGWEVIINSDEEIGSPGSSGLYEQAAARVQCGLLFEPSLPDGRLVSSRKGSGNFSIVARGRAAHSGRDFEQGINAIVGAAEVSAQLHRLTGHWDGLTLNVARIDGGSPSNIVPNTGVIRFNIRYHDRRQETEILKTIEDILARESHRSGVKYELHGQFSSPPKLEDAQTLQLLKQLQACGKSLGLELDWMASGGACDGNRLASFGVPNVDTLGVRGGKIHSSEEFVLLDSLTERARLTALFLMQLADGILHPPLRAGTIGVQ